MMKIRKTKDRVDDVTWIFSGFFSFPLFGFIFQIWGYLFEKGLLNQFSHCTLPRIKGFFKELTIKSL